jgi:hypothetical protein
MSHHDAQYRSEENGRIHNNDEGRWQHPELTGQRLRRSPHELESALLNQRSLCTSVQRQAFSLIKKVC